MLCECVLPPSVLFSVLIVLASISVLLIIHHWLLSRAAWKKDCLNWENSKTSSQPLLYLHLKSVVFCPVCFSVLKMHEPTVQERLFSPRSTARVKNSWKSFFFLLPVVWCWQCLTLLVPDKNMLALKKYTYRHVKTHRPCSSLCVYSPFVLW